jgi:cytochrome c
MAAFAAATFLLASPATLAAGDPATGQSVFARCAGCHSNSPGVNKIGPSLAGVIGRRSGTEPGYNYSPAMQGANITWNDATLDTFLASPGNTVHGTKMFFNVPGASDRQNVIAYLATLK